MATMLAGIAHCGLLGARTSGQHTQHVPPQCHYTMTVIGMASKGEVGDNCTVRVYITA
jgi:hypothetical protein